MSDGRKLSHIAFVSRNYPSPRHPYAGVFLEQLVRAIGRRGIQCTAIHPLQVHQWLRHVAGGGKAAGAAGGGPLRPVYLAASSRTIGPWNTMHVTQCTFQRAALRAVRRMPGPPDAVYGHFLYPGGAAAIWIGKRIDRPSFVAVGEGAFWSVKMGWDRARRDYRDVTGIVAVSSLLKRKIVEELGAPAEKVGVFPNGVDRAAFFPRPREEMREKWKLPQDRFLVAFVGNFIHEKGAARVAQAIAGLDGVGGVFAGTGPAAPAGREVLFARGVPHASVPEILSAADVFVLPTLVEGSCNALIEALACGLPVVSSAGEFNDDLLDEGVAIRIDPLDVSAIRKAVVALRDDAARRGRMGAAALARGALFDIDRRAEGICSFMAARI